jgi:ABC-type molybdate transport system substrate-binding protein
MTQLNPYVRKLYVAGWAALILGVGVHLAVPQDAVAEEITIAAASDLNFAIKDVIAEYEQVTGHHVKLSLGSSGNFYAQIQNGAPFDLYFSADIGYPKKLESCLGLYTAMRLVGSCSGPVMPPGGMCPREWRFFAIPRSKKLRLPIRNMRPTEGPP